MIQIDGSYLEGGGQILRISLFLSLLTNKPFYIYNIRRGRPNPGLKNQHLHIIKCLKEISDIKVEGDTLNSLEVKFFPGKIKGGKVKMDFKTAGSIPLFLQTIFPVSLISEKPLYLEIQGGTDVEGAPTFDYFRFHFLPLFEKILFENEIFIIRRGYYPQGGGFVKLKFHGKLDKINLNFGKGELKKIVGKLSGSIILKERRVLERMKESFLKKVKEINVIKDLEISYEESLSPGCAFFIKGIFDGNRELALDILCKKGVSSEKLGEEIADRFLLLLKRGDSPDPNLSDQLVPFLCLYGGEIFVPEPTRHFETAIWTCKHFLNFEVERREGFFKFIPL
ncbi:MAG: RNA 3'-terminal phosphate cyclase [candidate division WOR-3 bacterium]